MTPPSESLPEIVKRPEAGAEDALPPGAFIESIGEAQSGRHISVRRLVERSPARRQRDRRRIIKADHRERIVGRVLAPQRLD